MKIEHFSTVGELKSLLKDVPAEYGLTPYGDPKCCLGVSDSEKLVYIDDEDFIRDLLGEEGTHETGSV